MSFNGSGTYSPPGPQYPAIAGTLIKAADFNTIISDIAAALSMCLLKDGQQVPTANQPMGGLKHTGVGKAAARDQYATYEQLQDGEANFVTPANVAGAANAVTLSLSPAPSAYETAIDLFYIVEIENTSEDVTHNLNALGALNTKKFYGGTKVKVAIGDLQVGMMAHLKYDGTDLILMNPRGQAQATDVASAATIDLDACTGDLVDVTGTTTITAVTLRKGQERTVRFTGILTLTHGASLVLPGAVSIQTATGDFAVLRGYAAGVVRCVNYTRAAARGVEATDIVTATTEVVNSAALTAVYTKTIAAGVLGTDKVLRLRVVGDYLNDSGAVRQLNVKVAFGATNVFQGTLANIVNTVNRKTFGLDLTLHAKGATTSQVGFGTAALDSRTANSAPSANPTVFDHAAVASGHNAVAEDTTAAKDLVVSIQHSAANASLSFKLLAACLEIVG